MPHHLSIMQICLSHGKGGMELYMAKLAKFLDAKVKLSVVIVNNNQINSYFTTLKKPVYQVDKKLISAIKIAKIIDEDNIDIVHIHSQHDLLIALLARLLSKRKPKLIHTRHMVVTLSKNDFYHRFIYKNIDLMIGVTQQVKAQIEKFITPTPKTVVSYIGVEKKPQTPKKTLSELRQKYQLNAKFIACIVGRIEHKKGQHIVVDAVAKLLKQGVDIQLVIAGDAMTAAYLQELKQDINNRGLADKIIFTGFLSDASAVMQLSDVVILATEHETFGMVLVEAMQAGICVIASDRGGPLEIIEDNKTGLLFKSFDADDLSEKILNLYKNPDLRQSYALAGQKRAEEKFNDIKQFTQVMSLFVRLFKEDIK